ncbi:hypothetical protein Tco_0195102 [Tanacetum coccineum]
MQALKASKKLSKSQPHVRGSCKGTGASSGVPDESTVIFTTSSEGTSTKPGVLDEVKSTSKAEADPTDDDEESNDKFVHGDEYVHDDVDEEMNNAEDNETEKYDEEITNAEKIEVTKGDLEQEPADTEINSLFDIQIQQEKQLLPLLTLFPLSHLYYNKQTTPIPTPPITTEAPPVTTVPDPFPAIAQRVYVLEEDVQELNSQKDVSEIRKTKQETAAKENIPKFSATPYDQAAEAEFKQKEILFKMMTESKMFPEQPKQKKRDHGDDKDEDPSVGPNQVKKTKKRRTKESESSKKSSSSKGNSSPKTSKSNKPMHAEESFVVPTDEVIIDASIDDVVIDDDQPQDASKPKPDRAPKNDLFKQPPRPPTLDPEWNSHQVVDDQPEHTWFNDMVSDAKDTLTFDELMATPIDFFKFAMNRLKIDKLTKANLVGPIYNLLKGTCQSSIELEYNMEECYKALSNQLDWNNHEGDRCPFDLSKPRPLKGRPGHLTVASEYFFNNDLEYLTSSDPERSMLRLSRRQRLQDTMRRAGRQLYKFKEGDSMNLHLNDIEDMLLIVVQHKLFHLDGEVIVDLAVALRMFTRSLIIKKRVEDVQLELYTPSFDPPGVSYEDLSYLKRLMRADELYKFSDGTLKKVHDTLHHRLLNF